MNEEVARFIYHSDPETYHEHLEELAEWVNGFIVPVFVGARPPSSRMPWCAAWWKHIEAIGRLDALWLSYQELSVTEESGSTGPSVWFRDHLDPIMTQLRAPDGPFAGCMTKPGTPNHNDPQKVAVVELS
ncbi:DUF4913 domain-containing protein [Nocardiopsis rhodophaea]